VIVGGVGPLATQLKVSEAALRSWLEGNDEPPLEVFLATVEILLLNAGDAGRA
jgi:predicted transcriptional regulator